MNLNKEIGERLRLLRNELRMTQKDFSLRLGFKNHSAISMIESGINPITDQVMLMLQMSFNVNKNWLLLGKGEMFTEHQKVSHISQTTMEQKVEKLEQELLFLKQVIRYQGELIDSLRLEFNEQSTSSKKKNAK